jgi:hypothetical protein
MRRCKLEFWCRLKGNPKQALLPNATRRCFPILISSSPNALMKVIQAHIHAPPSKSSTTHVRIMLDLAKLGKQTQITKLQNPSIFMDNSNVWNTMH